MEVPRYTIEDQVMGPLVGMIDAAYTEIAITNHTCRDIVIVDHNNNRTIINRLSVSYSKEHVSISIRKGIGKTMNNRGGPELLNGQIIKIELQDILNNPVFINETNWVIGALDEKVEILHPYGCVTYSEALNRATEEISETLSNSPNMTMIANDPQKRIDKLFTSLSGNILTIPVTHIPDTEATLQLKVTQGEESVIATTSLEAFLSGTEDYLELETGLFPFVTSNKNQCEKLIRTYKPPTHQQIERADKEATLRIKEMEELTKVKLATMKEEYETKIKTLNGKLEIQNIELAKAKKDLEHMEALYNGIKAAFDARVIDKTTTFNENSITQKSEELEFKTSTAGYKHAEAQLDHEEARWKLIQTGATLILGGIGFKLLSFLWDKSRQTD